MRNTEASAAMTCFECGEGTLAYSDIDIVGERNGESFTVRMKGFECDRCGFKTVDSVQSAEFTRLVSDAYRIAHGLLTSAEIQARRHQLAMTQLGFSEYLGTGVASVKRWESGQIQDKAMDELIRLKTDPCAARKNLRTLEAQQIPEALVLWECDDIALTLTMDQHSHFMRRPAMTIETVSMVEHNDFSSDTGIAA
jgi:putative zinc finger/helix-turn-helix YgiT family protein